MKRKLLAGVALLAIGASLVSTGAFVDTPAETERVEMAPSGGPNSAYAVNESGQLMLDLSRSTQMGATEATTVNDDAVTEVANIFTVTYNGTGGDPPARVWFETDHDEITFVHGTESVESIDGEANSRTVAPEEVLHVGIIVDTTGTHSVGEIDEFTLVVEPTEGSDGAAPTGTDDPAGGDAEPTTGSGPVDTGSDGTVLTDVDLGGIDFPAVGIDDRTDTPGFNATGTVTQPTVPGPEETLGGFLLRTLLLLVFFLVAGTGLFAVIRRAVNGLTADRGG